MFFHRRHHRPSLLKLILVFLGFNFLTRRCGRQERSEEERKEFRSKARLFRSKLKEAFGVWEEEDAPATEQPAESETEAQ